MLWEVRNFGFCIKMSDQTKLFKQLSAKFESTTELKDNMRQIYKWYKEWEKIFPPELYEFNTPHEEFATCLHQLSTHDIFDISTVPILVEKTLTFFKTLESTKCNTIEAGKCRLLFSDVTCFGKNSQSDTLCVFAQYLVDNPRSVMLKISKKFPYNYSNSLAVELSIYMNLTNELLDRYVTPHLVRAIDCYSSTNLYEEIPLLANKMDATTIKSRLTKSGQGTGSNGSHILVLERINGPTLNAYMEGETPQAQLDTVVVSVLFQITYTLYVFAIQGMRHNDIHFGNVFLDRSDTEFLHYRVRGRVFRVPTYGICTKIYDYDHSSRSGPGVEKTNNPTYNNLLEDGLCRGRGECNYLNNYFDIFYVLKSVLASSRLSDELKSKILSTVTDFSQDNKLLYTVHMSQFTSGMCNLKQSGSKLVCDGEYQTEGKKLIDPLSFMEIFPPFLAFLIEDVPEGRVFEAETSINRSEKSTDDKTVPKSAGRKKQVRFQQHVGDKEETSRTRLQTTTRDSAKIEATPTRSKTRHYGKIEATPKEAVPVFKPEPATKEIGARLTRSKTRASNNGN